MPAVHMVTFECRLANMIELLLVMTLPRKNGWTDELFDHWPFLLQGYCTLSAYHVPCMSSNFGADSSSHLHSVMQTPTQTTDHPVHASATAAVGNRWSAENIRVHSRVCFLSCWMPVDVVLVVRWKMKTGFCSRNCERRFNRRSRRYRCRSWWRRNTKPPAITTMYLPSSSTLAPSCSHQSL